jgi:hypothetical protein
LRLYGTSESSWLKISEEVARFFDIWDQSRIWASGRGFLYHLYHRWTFFKAPHMPWQWQIERLKIADALRAPSTPQDRPKPEIILIDNVSRALGQPDLTGYRLGNRSGSIEIWARDDVADLPETGGSE